MDFGIAIGPRGATGTPDGIKARVEQAERLGFTYLGMPDHIVFPDTSDSRYPYAPDGKHPSIGSGYALEQLSCLTFAGALTNSIRLLTSVMVVPHRHPILAAKQLATIDILTKGRLTVGCGVGWLEEEIDALGATEFKKRGAATDSFIRAFRELWTQSSPRFADDHVSFDRIKMEPKPVQRSGPPIWIGGEGKAARRRAARLGDGWYPVIRNPAEPLDKPQAFAAALADMRREAEAAGRDPAKIDVAIYANGFVLGAARKDADGTRVSFTGSAAEIAEDARAFAAVGVDHVIISFESNDLNQSLDIVEALAKDVIPQARS